MPWLLGEKKKIALQLLALEDDIKDDIAADPTNNFDISEKLTQQ